MLYDALSPTTPSSSVQLNDNAVLVFQVHDPIRFGRLIVLAPLSHPHPHLRILPRLERATLLHLISFPHFKEPQNTQPPLTAHNRCTLFLSLTHLTQYHQSHTHAQAHAQLTHLSSRLPPLLPRDLLNRSLQFRQIEALALELHARGCEDSLDFFEFVCVAGYEVESLGAGG